MRQLVWVGSLVISAVVSLTLALREPAVPEASTLLLSAREQIGQEDAAIHAKTTLALSAQRFTFTIDTSQLRITSEGRVQLESHPSAPDRLLLQIETSQIAGEFQNLPSSIRYLWLRAATPGQELHLIKRGACWQAQQSYWRLCPEVGGSEIF